MVRRGHITAEEGADVLHWPEAYKDLYVYFRMVCMLALTGVLLVMAQGLGWL